VVPAGDPSATLGFRIRNSLSGRKLIYNDRVLTISTFALLTALLHAQAEPVPKYDVKRASSRIVVDGKLDEAAWSAAAPAMEFVFPWDTQTGAKQKTKARILWDDKNLYVGYEAEDLDIVAFHSERDDPTYLDDCLEIFINPNPKQHDFYYGLEMNAKAVLYDYFYAFPKFLMKRFNLNNWQLATFTRGTLNQRGDKDEGWGLEVAIPWENFEELTGGRKVAPEPGSVWNVNLNRWDGVEPNRRLSQWSNSGLDKPNPHNPSRFGEIVFVK
jgi:hypothetical protein